MPKTESAPVGGKQITYETRLPEVVRAAQDNSFNMRSARRVGATGVTTRGRRA